MRYALVAPAILAVTALAAPVPNQDDLIGTVAAVNLREADITGTAKRSEDLSVNNVIPLGLGVPAIVRRGAENGEQEDGGDEGVLDLGLLGIVKRDNSLATDGDAANGDDLLGGDGDGDGLIDVDVDL